MEISSINKTIAISGSSGFVGTHLIKYFEGLECKVLILTREILNDEEKLNELISKTNIVINLAGANIVEKWTPQYKEILYKSRIDTTAKIVNAINSCENKPEQLISTSAIGIYKSNDTYDENGEFENDFLSNLCQDWEKEALKAQTKVAIFRFGVVLGKNGGALKKMLLPFKLGLGGVIGNGNQAFSFIHIDDLKSAYTFVINNHLDGVFNLCSPKPSTNFELTRVLGRVLGRPTILPLPEFVLKFLYSEGAKVLTDGQDVIPAKLLSLGFKFEYKTMKETIYELCR